MHQLRTRQDLFEYIFNYLSYEYHGDESDVKQSPFSM